MRLVMECEHEQDPDRQYELCLQPWCLVDRTITDPAAILEALTGTGNRVIGIAEVNSLLVAWVEQALSVIYERSGSFDSDIAALRAEALARCERLGIDFPEPLEAVFYEATTEMI